MYHIYRIFKAENNSLIYFSFQTNREHHFSGILVEFAIQLMTLLDQINKESFQRFQMRVGLNQGQVVAGIIGAQKPQYDIWGNTVNVASRMESTGEFSRIQVTDETASILNSTGHECLLRGPTFVKGKGVITTYWVKTPFDGKKIEALNTNYIKQ